MPHTPASDLSHRQIKELTDKVAQLEILLAQQQTENCLLAEKIRSYEYPTGNQLLPVAKPVLQKPYPTLSPEVIKNFHTLEELPVGIVLLDMHHGALIKANTKARQILKLTDNFHQSEEESFSKIDWSEITEQLAEDHFIENKEIEIRLADGSKKWILFSGKFTQHHDLCAVMVDFTSTKETINELQKVNTELDNFVYHASHDLRAPLRTVLGLLSSLKQETNKDERIRCVDLIEGSITRLDTLIIDLLSISRNSRTEQLFKDINFMVEVNTAVSYFYHVGDTRNLQIAVKVSQPVRYISDQTRIRIILNNLISNAIKYRQPRLELSYINISIYTDERWAYLTIEDNGEGIAAENLPTIFDMFSRASEKSEGTGLGLYIVKDIVEKLNGTIEVSSEHGVGTTFTLTLPNYLLATDTLGY